jgi:uncharacterized protein
MKINIVILLTLISAATLAEPTADDHVVFGRRDLSVGREKIKVEVAENPEQLEYGLMFPENECMIFIFDHEQPLNFWMKNTHIPLSVGFFDRHGVLIDIQEMTAVSKMDQGPYPQYASKKKAQFALEMNKEWFKKHNIALKARLSPLPKLHEGRE